MGAVKRLVVSCELDPYMYARVHEITILVRRGFPWLVASNGDTVICSPHDDSRVQTQRAWEGIAQCLLTRRGSRWSPAEAAALGRRLQRQQQQIQ